MKHLFYLFIVSSLIFTSCNKDDDNTDDTDDNESSIVATWKLTSFTENGEPLSIGNCDILTTFNSNGSGTTIDPEPPNCDSNETFNFMYSISGDQLTVNDEDGPYTVEIETLNNTQLVLKDEEENEGDVTVYISTYVKQ